MLPQNNFFDLNLALRQNLEINMFPQSNQKWIKQYGQLLSSSDFRQLNFYITFLTKKY